MMRDLISRWKTAMPMVIIGYVVALASLRLSLSDMLEVDEAQFVGQVDFRLVFENSHPPLYNWLVRIALEITGWEWAQAVALVKYGLLAAYYLLIWKAARRLVDDRAAVVAVAAAAFMPQVVWMSAHTLAHSVMVMMGVVATVHATLVALQEPSWRAYIWLGVAAAIGTLAKYNYFVFALPFFAVVLANETMRARLYRREALAAIGVYVALVAPTLIAAVASFGASTERIGKLYRADPDIAWFDLPFIGLDGFVSMIGATIAWIGPAVLIWAIARFWDARLSGNAETENIFADALGRAMAIALGLFALIVIFGDMHRVHERYLTPIFAAAPIYLAIAWPLSRSAYGVVPLAAVLFIAVFGGFWGMATYGSHRYAYPYDSIARHLRRAAPEPLPIVAGRQVDRANLILQLDWPGAKTPTLQPVENDVVLLWRGRREAPAHLAPAGFGPADKITTIVQPLRNARGDPLVYRFQRFERTGVDAADVVSETSPGSE